MTDVASGRSEGRHVAFDSFAGWLFADLLLVLFLVGIGSALPAVPPHREPQKVEPVATLEPAGGEKLITVGMATRPLATAISFNASALVSGGSTAAAESRRVCRSIRAATTSIRSGKSALVLIFARSSDPGRGVQLAQAIGRQLTCANARLFPTGTPFRDFWKGGAEGTADLEIYLFTTESTS